jgi:hypothetical protein
MKINILHKPPDDIFKNRRNYTLIFITLLALACCGLLLGVYAIIADTVYYEQLETLALIFFVAPTPFIAYIGEKLQAYKKLTPPQCVELTALGQQYPEVEVYCDLAAKASRQPIRVEYEACQAWAEKASRQAE